ncbi:type VI lipase adapter Tla3 domain-containing protein [Herbaspirillum camelliae]|uniref:type VI lipase adapter Tla3 domain-containing protein n=1 Tax=Herbaspirillum camelliae TaxID=1892903 RepID=UPI000949C7DE|nr:DUF2875 family protein [Herbaspirillum camelliae]
MMLEQMGKKFVLEVRGMGVVVGQDTDEEIWRALEKKANSHKSYRSRNPEDYTNSADERLSMFDTITDVSFGRGAGNTVDQWPLPGIEAKADLAAHAHVGWSLQVNTVNGRTIPGRRMSTLVMPWANNSNGKDV